MEFTSLRAEAEGDEFGHTLYGGPGDWEIVEAVRAVAAERGVTPSEVALAWLLSRPAVAAPIVGATKLPHLDAAIQAVGLELTAEEIARLEAAYQPHAIAGHH